MNNMAFVTLLACLALPPAASALDSAAPPACTQAATPDLQAQNAAVVRRYLNALFKTRDMAAISAIVASKAVYYQAPGLPYGGTFTGFDEWLTMFTRSAGFYSGVELLGEPVLYVAPGNQSMIASFPIKFQSKKSGKDITLPIAEQFDLCNGKITSIRPFYFDTKAIADLLQ